MAAMVNMFCSFTAQPWAVNAAARSGCQSARRAGARVLHAEQRRGRDAGTDEVVDRLPEEADRRVAAFAVVPLE